ncbi:MAG: hypothetical protein K6E62_07540 [Lachnospiraceae bacterium]|nr:hypothetical protein [Lachnospiraceae bacterium]
MESKRRKVFVIAALQLMNILYSLNSVLIKFVSMRWEKEGLFSVKTISLLAGAIAIMVVYAIIWQIILAKVDLTVAYMCKGMIIFWGMIWAYLFFDENISALNIFGTFLIFGGTFLVTSDE